MEKKTTKKCGCGCGVDIPKGLQKYYSEMCRERAKKARDKKKKWLKSRGVTKKKLDSLWSKLVRLRDGKCMYCGSTEYPNAHHIFSRSNHTTRYDLNNGITLCSKHHLFDNSFSAHKAPLEFIEWLKGFLGDVYIDNLRAKAQKVNRKSNEEWMEYLKEMEKVING